MTYEELLQKAPSHSSDEFVNYLRENNKVVHECAEFIIIENFKYHTAEKPWHTLFMKCSLFPNCYNCAGTMMKYLSSNYEKWQWLKKSADIQTVNRFHIHLTP